jgi:hypothetical protein
MKRKSPMGLVPTIGSRLRGRGGLRGLKKKARLNGRADKRLESGTFGMSEPVDSADGTSAPRKASIIENTKPEKKENKMNEQAILCPGFQLMR